jgi:hypothetical protein
MIGLGGGQLASGLDSISEQVAKQGWAARLIRTEDWLPEKSHLSTVLGPGCAQVVSELASISEQVVKQARVLRLVMAQT